MYNPYETYDWNKARRVILSIAGIISIITVMIGNEFLGVFSFVVVYIVTR